MSPCGVTRPAARAEQDAIIELGHGAGGGVESPDLVGATETATEARLNVALAEQPYRVTGWRSPAPTWRLDEIWLEIVPQLFPDGARTR